MKKLLIATTATLALFSGLAQAVPWCHHGTIVQIQDVTWNEAQIFANFTGSIPSLVTDPEVYTAATAAYNYASTFAGGGGGFGGYSVPGSGQVKVFAYAPYSYTNMVGPGYYDTSQGLSFKLKKCYTIPPMVAQVEIDKLDNPTGPIISVKPYPALESIVEFWEQPVQKPGRPTVAKELKALERR